MPNLNAASAFFGGALVELVLGISFLLLWTRKKTPYLSLWAAAFLSCGIGALLVIGRNIIPDFFSIIGGVFCLTLSSVFFYTGICEFFNRTPSRLPWIVLVLEVVLLAFYSYINYDTNIRTHIYSTAQIVIALLILHALLSAKKDHQKKYVGHVEAVIATIFFLFLMVMRIAGTLYAPGPQDLLSSMRTSQVLFSFGIVLSHVSYALAFLTMHASSLQTKLESVNQYLLTLSTIDQLTGLPNRRALDSALNREWDRLSRHEWELTVMMCDVDYFKQYNDHYGHDAGDQCLRKVAIALSKPLNRPADLVARYGGEEFTILLPDTSPASAKKLAEKMQEQVARMAIPHTGSPEYGVVTVSIGFSSVGPGQQGSIEDLMKRADEALYEAKNNGRNRAEYLKGQSSSPAKIS